MRFLLLLGLLATPTFAANSNQIKSVVEALPSCQNFIRYDDQFVYAGFDSAGQATPLLVRDLGNRGNNFTLTVSDAAIDVVRHGDSLFVLTANRGLEEWSLSTKAKIGAYKTYKANSFDYQEQPTGMVLYKDKIFISHGRLGLSVFDTNSKSLVWENRLVEHQAPLESMATGITIQGNRAFIVMDNFSLAHPGEKQALRGIVIFNADTLSVEAELDGMDPGADAISSDANRLIVSFRGMPIWKYDLSAFADTRIAKMPEPMQRLYKYPEFGHPIGKASLDESFYYTCFVAPPHKNLPAKYMPRVWDRKEMHLD